MTDWSKVMDVFSSGVIGVYLIMVILMIFTKLGVMAVDYFESWNKGPAPEQK